MKKPRNYINNRTLYENMILHKQKTQECIELNKPKPLVSNYIGESIYFICKNLSTKSNFGGYTYRDEMISDGLVDCLAAIDNFDPNKTNNPFAYFTQIAWNAFVRRIHKEKKQSYIKHKNFQITMLNDMSEFSHNKELKNEYSDDIIRIFESNLIKNKKENIIKETENE